MDLWRQLLCPFIAASQGVRLVRDRMRVATFNIENFFTRVRALNAVDSAENKQVMEDVVRLQELIAKDAYSASDKSDMKEILERNNVEQPAVRNFFVQQIRGRFTPRLSIIRLVRQPFLKSKRTDAPSGPAGSSLIATCSIPKRSRILRSSSAKSTPTFYVWSKSKVGPRLSTSTSTFSNARTATVTKCSSTATIRVVSTLPCSAVTNCATSAAMSRTRSTSTKSSRATAPSTR